MYSVTDKPLAGAGLKSYRYRMDYGYVMIGALNDQDALNQAFRSVSPTVVTFDRLEVWDGGKYVPVI